MSNLVEALRAGATVVTPNNRLARDVVARFDAARHVDNIGAWEAARAISWTLWLSHLWRASVAGHAEAAPPAVLQPGAADALWHLIVARHGHDWLNSRGAARHAADAWRTFHAWRDEGERLGGVTGAALHEDPAVFGLWAERYQARLDALDAIDDAQLPDRLAMLAARTMHRSPPVILYGFLSLTPQQRRLVATLRGAGMSIDAWAASGNENAHRSIAAFDSGQDEIAAALADARTRIERDPHARVAVVVADLDQRRTEVIALADELLCPERAIDIAADAVRPYGISLGEPLSSLPIVASALDLIAAGCGRVEAWRASSVVRSPFIPDGDVQWTARAECERTWADSGERHVGWHEILLALRPVDPALHWRLASLQPPSSATRLPREWARAWTDWLTAVGWPGSAGLTSAQWQAREAWSASLARFASLGSVTGALSAVAALDALRASLGDTLFQPEAAPAQIQILGTLEAAGIRFDHAWLAGFDAQRWPGTTAPNPLLPLRWQVARHVPRAHPDTLLEQATAVTSALLAIAPEIIVSHARVVDDAPASLSPLLSGADVIDGAELVAPMRLHDMFAALETERWPLQRAPSLPPGSVVRGGAQMLESQSTCPFQAFARYRLRADEWPVCPEGLSAKERGTILHAVLKAFWDVVGDHASLIALDEPSLAERIDAAIHAGKAKVAAARWRALAPAVANAESNRLAATLRAWIDEGERPRPSFRVRSHESLAACEIDGVVMGVRVDRIDEFAEGGLAIVDYKSGTAVGPARWLRHRPEGIQVAVYADAVDQSGAGPVRALAYAQLKAGNVAIVGLAESAALWPALDTVESARTGLPTWDEARNRLQSLVATLARDFRDGIADVAPRDATACRQCGLHPLCRIQALGDDELVSGDGGD